MAKKRSIRDLTPEELIDSCLDEDPMVPGPIPMWIPSGCSQLDWVMGQGWPCGRMVEMYGDASSGKTLLALLACKSAIKMGGSAVYIDMEAAYNPEWAEKLGVPTKGLIVRTPYDLEQVHDLIDNIAENHNKFNMPLVIVWDSMAASASSASVRRKSAKEAPPIASESRLNSDFFRKKALKLIRNLPICLIVVNQVRAKIGGMPFDNETTTGGRATEFYASVRLKVKRKRIMKPKREGAKPIGAFITVTNKKNKVSHPFLKADFPIYFERGVDNIYEILYYCELTKLLSVSGNGRLTWKDKSYTRAALWNHFHANHAEFAELKEMARQAYHSDSPFGEESYDAEE
jgi:recombination protein RecA